MIQCKRFRWEDEFNEWAKTANICGDQVVVILHATDDSMMIFYDKSSKHNRPSNDWWKDLCIADNKNESYALNDSITIPAHNLN